MLIDPLSQKKGLQVKDGIVLVLLHIPLNAGQRAVIINAHVAVHGQRWQPLVALVERPKVVPVREGALVADVVI